MKQVSSFEEMESGETYSYGNTENPEQTFRFEKSERLDFVSLHYKDGYVGEPPKENFKRHISEGKVYEH